MPSACTPIRLISLLNSQRASYSRKPVAFTIGSDSKADVLGRSTAFGFGNIRASSERSGLLRSPLANAHGKGKAGGEIMVGAEGATMDQGASTLPQLRVAMAVKLVEACPARIPDATSW